MIDDNLSTDSDEVAQFINGYSNFVYETEGTLYVYTKSLP